MTASEYARAVRFGHAFARRQAPRVADVPGGFVTLDDDHPAVHDLNRLHVTAPTPAAELVGTAETVLGGAGLRHRLVCVDAPVGDGFVAEFADAGYEPERELLMAYGGAPEPAVPVTVTVVDPDILLAPAERAWRDSLPGLPDATYRQLAGQRTRRPAGTEFLAVLGPDGAPRAWCELYLSAPDGVAQVEDVLTLPAYRGRGHATALVATGVRRAAAAGCDLTFLRVDADDGPVGLYRRLGFYSTGEAHRFHRAGAGAAHPTDETGARPADGS
ncbi:MAG TPA: GNAT family N-acetyltransferase [Actinocatenispora sp.]